MYRGGRGGDEANPWGGARGQSGRWTGTSAGGGARAGDDAAKGGRAATGKLFCRCIAFPSIVTDLERWGRVVLESPPLVLSLCAALLASCSRSLSSINWLRVRFLMLSPPVVVIDAALRSLFSLLLECEY
jgi:hypothetical protein